MPEVELEIKNKVGLHARPAALFVQTAIRFKSIIMVKKGDAKVNAKSILNILTLGAEKGNIITVIAEGEDAEQALKALVEMHSRNFGEKE